MAISGWRVQVFQAKALLFISGYLALMLPQSHYQSLKFRACCKHSQKLLQNVIASLPPAAFSVSSVPCISAVSKRSGPRAILYGDITRNCEVMLNDEGLALP